MIPPELRNEKVALPQNYRFVKIPLRILEWPISPTAFRAWVIVFRLTYGFGKSQDAFSLERLVGETMLPRRSLQRALDELESAGLLRVARKLRAHSTYEPLFPRFYPVEK